VAVDYKVKRLDYGKIWVYFLINPVLYVNHFGKVFSDEFFSIAKSNELRLLLSNGLFQQDSCKFFQVLCNLPYCVIPLIANLSPFTSSYDDQARLLCFVSFYYLYEDFT